MTKFKSSYGLILVLDLDIIKVKYLKNWIFTAKSSPVAGSTLPTAHCTLQTAPAPAPEFAPAPASVHFILHNKHCTLHVYSA